MDEEMRAYIFQTEPKVRACLANHPGAVEHLKHTDSCGTAAAFSTLRQRDWPESPGAAGH